MRPITATLNLEALRRNYDTAQRHARGAKALAVIKANAYGHGVTRAARVLQHADGFAVVELDAAVRLREAGHRQRIVLLEGFFEPDELGVIVEHRLATAVHCVEQLDMLQSLESDAGLDVLIKINTGMNRLGFQPDEFAAALERLTQTRGVGSITLMTHFANADDERGVDWQLEALERIAGRESAAGALARSLANSAAILRYPHTHAQWVRPGIMLYGCSPFAESVGSELGLTPVMTLASEIIALRTISAGEAVGYGGAYKALRKTRIGVVACGYADGYPRHAPTGTPVLVGGTLTRTVGRVSMDMLCVDLTGIDASVGTRVVLWGDGLPVETVASAAGTVGYELLCALAPRVRIVEKPLDGAAVAA